MKRMLVLCMTPSCTTVLWSMEWDKENPGFELIETTGAIDGHEMCAKCRNQPKTPVILPTPPVRFGEEKTENFEEMMAKRKLENRKKSGKGPPRGGGR